MAAQQPPSSSASTGFEELLRRFSPESFTSPATDMRRAMAEAEDRRSYVENITEVGQMHSRTLGEAWSAALTRQMERLWSVAPKVALASPQDAADYVTDFAQRQALFVDTLRRRGNQFVRHEEEGCPPVLAYEYEVIIDGLTLERPVNYSLVRIKPSAGTETRDDARPYIIIDPRAGHGSGIGGFKHESEVGVALAAGHPTYFVIFRPHPTKTQTIADVCRAEAQFVREVRRRHTAAPKPIVIGNCQGGWAAMILTATNPDLTGPVVINGAPLSYWAGIRGKDPMRYFGGLAGGIAPALMMADLGNGEFDGANLVLNFEALSPANTWWFKYYDLFAKGDDEAERYLQFERWWSGFYFMNEKEYRWIVENLFIGNKLARGGAFLDARTPIDLRNIRAPVIVFASHGDNITPVPQALNWIAETYASVHDIKARGQRIIYTVHDSIGHLGIFVSSSVAKKQHREIVSTLRTIEAMAPGLYEMKIVDVSGEGHSRTYEVDFEERTLDDIRAFCDDKPGDGPFRAMARVSEMNAELYNLTLRPWLKAMVSPASAKMAVDSHPLRLRRYLFSDRNPLLASLPTLADEVRKTRQPASSDNAFIALEQATSQFIGDCWDLYRDCRDAAIETSVLGLYGLPVMQFLAQDRGRGDELPPADDLRSAPDVHAALEAIEQGGFAEAVIRMLVQLAHSRGSVRRDRLERSNEVLTKTEPFSQMDEYRRNRIIQQQSIIVDFEPDAALTTLPRLLPHKADRARAMEICEYIVGAREEMEEATIALFLRMREILEMDDDAVTARPKAAPAAPSRTTARRRSA